MREIKYKDIVSSVAKLCVDACCIQTDDIKKAFCEAKDNETSPLGKIILEKLIENGKIAETKLIPMCQDTGMAVIFLELGQDVRVVGGYLEDAINEGVRKGYMDGYLRKSIVSDPLFDRKNTSDNTPAVIHTKIVIGDRLKVTMIAKGFGSENKSVLKMLVPSDGIDGIKKVFMEAINLAGPNACPPLIIGIGIGGTMEKAALLSKIATTRDIGSHNKDERYAKLEDELLEIANNSGIGPQGLGGDTTAFAVNIEYYPTHIAGLPVAINITCHATRHTCVTL